jgi:hypothetical protein
MSLGTFILPSPLQRVVRPRALEPLSQLISRELTIPQYLTEQARPDVFSGVDGNDGSASVRMAHEMMTSFDPCGVEAATAKRCDQFLTGKGGKGTHASTVTR